MKFLVILLKILKSTGKMDFFGTQYIVFY